MTGLAERVHRRRQTPPDSYRGKSQRECSREALTLERMRTLWGVSREERDACAEAAHYVGTSTPTLDVLATALYGRTMEDMTPAQSRRTDKLLYVVHRLALREGLWPEEAPHTPRRAETKVCASCGEDRPASAYWRNAAQRDGLQSECKRCMRGRRAS